MLKQSLVAIMDLCWKNVVRDSFRRNYLCIQFKLLSKSHSFVFILDNYSRAKLSAAEKGRLRRLVPINYCENEKKNPVRRCAPKSECAKIREKIMINVERITYLKRGISIHNRLKDRDVEEIQELLNSSDEDTVEDEAAPLSVTNNDESAEDLIDMVSEMDYLVDEPNEITTGITGLEGDRDFSLEYGYTTDVS